MFIDAKTGQFVTEAYAKSNPDTTVEITPAKALENASVTELIDELHRRYHL